MNMPHPHEDVTRTTPLGLARYASEFMEAALAADDKMGKKSGHEIVAPVPVMFLVGQAIELSLKSFLLSRGVSLHKLRRDYGHNLHRSLRKAKELGLGSLVQFTEEEQSVLSLLDNLYSSKQLQYIITGATTFPVFGPLERAALKLIHAVGTEVGWRTNKLPTLL